MTLTATNKKFAKGILLFFFFLLNRHTSFFGTNSYSERIEMLVMVLVFVLIHKQWKQFADWRNPKKLRKNDIKIGVCVLLIIFIYKTLGLTGTYLNNHEIQESVIAISKKKVQIWISPFLEELLFTGVIFNTLWGMFKSNQYFQSKNIWFSPSVIISFLITFYWFLLGHLYETKFLNNSCSLSERILNFPVDVFLWPACSVLLFIKTRSLIFGILGHYLSNGLIFLYIYLVY